MSLHNYAFFLHIALCYQAGFMFGDVAISIVLELIDPLYSKKICAWKEEQAPKSRSSGFALSHLPWPISNLHL